MPLFDNFIGSTTSVKMTVKAGSQQARGPMVTHERVDQMVLQNGTTNGSGTFFAVFGLRDGKIVDFIDFQIALADVRSVRLQADRAGPAKAGHYVRMARAPGSRGQCPGYEQGYNPNVVRPVVF